MKVGLIFGRDDINHKPTAAGTVEAGYLILRAMAWFGRTGAKVFQEIVVFSSGREEDITAATLAVGFPDGNHSIHLELLPNGWGFGGDVYGEPPVSKAKKLGERINAKKSPCVLVFGYFYWADRHDHEGNFNNLLAHWDIPLPEKEWKFNHPILVMIDTDAKTVEYDYAPYPPLGE